MFPYEVVVLPFLLGLLAMNAAVDSVWYRALGTDQSQLKSKVTVLARSAAINYYKAVYNAPRELHYFGVALLALLLLLALSKTMAHHRRSVHVPCLMLSFCASAALLLRSMPALRAVGSDRKLGAQMEAVQLFTLAQWNLIAAALLAAQLIVLLAAYMEQKPKVYKQPLSPLVMKRE